MKKSLLFAIVVLVFSAFSTKAQECSDLIISEYLEGWSVNNALELYNPTSEEVDLSTYRLVRYSNGNIPPAADKYIDTLSGTIKPYRTKVFVRDARSSAGTAEEDNGVVYEIWAALEAHGNVQGNQFLSADYETNNTLFYNGDDVIALEKLTGTNGELDAGESEDGSLFVDIFGQIGVRPLNAEGVEGGSGRFSGGWGATDPFWKDHASQQEIWTVDHTLIRKASVKKGQNDNMAPYFNPAEQWDSLPANTFTQLNWHECDCRPANTKPVQEQTLYAFYFDKTNIAVNDELGSVAATDADDDNLVYFIRSGNIYDPFKIDAANGTLALRSKEDLSNTSYGLTISITDGTEPVYAYVNLHDEYTANTDPEFLAESYSFEVSQYAAVGTEVGEVDASDADYHRVNYSITSGNTSDAFAINMFGEITVAGTLDNATTPQYTLEVEATDGYTSATMNVTIDVTTSSSIENADWKGLQLYPNPASDILHISLDNGVRAIEINNLTGQQVYRKYVENQSYIDIPLINIEGGIYMVKITDTKNNTITKKLIVR